jgi:hypothetical protein
MVVDVPRPYKREAGMTKVFATPLPLRISGVPVDPELEARVPALLGQKLVRYAKDVTRVALRFSDGPVCRIEMFVNHRKPLVVEARARDAAEAFRKASALARTALSQALEKSATRRPKRKLTRKTVPRARRTKRA